MVDVSEFRVVVGHRGRKRLVFPEEAQPILRRQRRWQDPTAPPIQAMLGRAHELMGRLNGDPGLTRHALAKKIGMNPSYLTRILNLLNLAPEIQDFIASLPPRRTKGPITESRLKHIARIADHQDQLQQFELLKARPIRRRSTSVPATV